ncbi:hypothetical protein [Aliarcobacter butzleri]|uniref:hypothetical protein n=1 Tax=Aliarcobacter butzleri TaxID=28197 RepID=UPI00125EE401|nr:hypothetical protein [Aliarcobacter butzleri]MCG3665085.1 hypothetical protein [Aliarcobacter butzleri]MCT7638385.1 hypothetical protein [Aliarcobacter butzleri]
MHIFSEIIDSETKPKIKTIKDNHKITTKQTYETEIKSSNKTGACKRDNQIIIKSEKNNNLIM